MITEENALKNYRFTDEEYKIYNKVRRCLQAEELWSMLEGYYEDIEEDGYTIDTLPDWESALDFWCRKIECSPDYPDFAVDVMFDAIWYSKMQHEKRCSFVSAADMREEASIAL